jgi:hypothetical protein
MERRKNGGEDIEKGTTDKHSNERVNKFNLERLSPSATERKECRDAT